MHAFICAPPVGVVWWGFVKAHAGLWPAFETSCGRCVVSSARRVRKRKRAREGGGRGGEGRHTALARATEGRAALARSRARAPHTSPADRRGEAPPPSRAPVLAPGGMAENVALAGPLTPVGNGAHAAPTPPLGKAAQAAPRTPGVLKSGGPRRVLTPHGKAMFAERARDAARADASGLKSPLAVDALARVMASVASAAYDQREGAAEELNTDADAVAFPDFGDCGGASPAQPSPATSDGSVRDSEPGTPVDAAAQMARAMANTPTNPLFDAGEDDIPTSDVDDGAEAAINVPQRVPMAGHVSGTPQRVRLSDCDAGAETCQASFGSPERSPIGGGRTLVLRRANASERTELGTAAVLTPVRRSTRKTPSKVCARARARDSMSTLTRVHRISLHGNALTLACVRACA